MIFVIHFSSVTLNPFNARAQFLCLEAAKIIPVIRSQNKIPRLITVQLHCLLLVITLFANGGALY